MELEGTEINDERRRKTVLIAFSIFIGILIILTLFSNTLLSLTLPKVRTEQAVIGQLEHLIEGYGLLQPREESELTTDAGWKVEKIHVKEGEMVQAGQLLVTFETNQALRDILDEQARLSQMRLSLEKQQDQYIDAYKNGEEMQMRDASRELESFKLDIEVQERRLQSMQEEVEKNKELKAPFDGRVTKIYAVEGQSSGAGQSVMQLSNISEGFHFLLQVSAEQAVLLEEGEQLQVTVKGSETKVVVGEVLKWSDFEVSPGMAGEADGQMNSSLTQLFSITVQDEGFEGGEQASIRLSKPSTDEALLVSNEAIRQDRSGQYVYVIEDKKGPLGNTFYVRKVYIQTGGVNERETAVLSGLFLYDQIIVESGEPLQVGNRVRLQ